ncbi:hypothetical protein [Paenibacillus sp. GCM10012306]|uniref:hypothetical protein n=1 Tax=Paenibacillus sp. GCM10012306 TaxID=3317342 RepID=UPI0036084E05
MTLKWFEEEIIRIVYTYRFDYERNNGFSVLATAIEELVSEGFLTPIKSSQKTYKSPFIHTAYWLNENAPASGSWSTSAMLRMQELLDLHFYDKHPETQTEENWARIERVYSFLRILTDRELVTREERLLAKNLRVPQEILNYEVMARLAER